MTKYFRVTLTEHSNKKEDLLIPWQIVKTRFERIARPTKDAIYILNQFYKWEITPETQSGINQWINS
jgi:hypothetical protein